MSLKLTDGSVSSSQKPPRIASAGGATDSVGIPFPVVKPLP